MSSPSWCSTVRRWLLRKQQPISIYTIASIGLTAIYRSLSTFQAYFQPLINALRNPSTLKNINIPNPQELVARLCKADKKTLAFYGVTAAEVLGFFTVGEMIGRRKIVGYRGAPEHAHGH